MSSSKIYKLIDRDDMSKSEVGDTDCIVLSGRNLEYYMLDDEIIKKLCKNQEYKFNSILDCKNKLLSNSNTSDEKKLNKY